MLQVIIGRIRFRYLDDGEVFEMRKIVTEDALEKLAGRLVPIQRNTKIFDGDEFDCCCGRTHVFQTGITNVTHEGFNGKFILICGAELGRFYMVLIKTRMRFGVLYGGLELLGGIRLNSAA